jgi:hypothetical protein
VNFFRTWNRDRSAKKKTRLRERQRQDAAYADQTIRAFLDGAGGAHDWDAFTSCSLRDPQVDTIRKRAGAVDLPVGPEERATLEVLADEAARLAKG